MEERERQRDGGETEMEERERHRVRDGGEGETQ